MWRGGIHLKALKNNEEQAYGSHYCFRQNAPQQWTN
jgi:hypothetical protein